MSGRFELTDCVPRELGLRAAAGEVAAGLLPLVDFFRLQERFERVGHFGIAVRGRVRSAMLFSRKPIRQLDGATVAVTEESSTTACLLRLLLEVRYKLTPPPAYQRGRHPDAARPPGPTRPTAGAGGDGQGRAGDALLLIGDEALRFQHTNTSYPFEIDVAFEWWLWQHLPFVFAVWAVRKDVSPAVKKALELGLTKSLAANTHRLETLAQEYAKTLKLPEAELHAYLSNFIYRLSRPEEEAIARFKELVDEHHLL